MDECNEAIQLIAQVQDILENKWNGRRSPMERVVLLKLEEALRRMEDIGNLYKHIEYEVRRIGGE